MFHDFVCILVHKTYGITVDVSYYIDTVWGQALSGLITVLEDKEYMVTLREKMNNIKKVAKFYNYDLLLAKK